MAVRRNGGWALAALVALTVSGCSSTDPKPAATTTGAPVIQPGGTITVVTDAEPATLNPRTGRGNTTATRDVVRSVLPAVWTITDKLDFTLNTDLVLSVETPTPLTIVYRLNPSAVWADGDPLDADDFVYNFEVQRGGTDKDGAALSVVAPNENVIETVIGSDANKTVTVTLRQAFSDWKALFLTPLVPAHEARAKGWNRAFDNDILSAGPFKVASFNRGKDLTLVRNDKYWGKPANLDSIVYRFVAESAAAVTALRSGEVQLIVPRIQVELKAQVDQIEGVRGVPIPSLQYEYIDMNLRNPLLAIVEVRKAIALAIDRQVIVSTLLGKVDPSAKVLNNRLFLNNQKEYKDTSDGQYDRANPMRAHQLLQGAGFAVGSDGIFAKDGQRLSLGVTSTEGDALRKAQEVLLLSQAKAAGIEKLRIENVADSSKLSEVLLGGTFDLANVFQTVVFVSATSSVFSVGSPVNVSKYASKDRRVDDLYTQARAEQEEQKRTNLYYEIDRILWQDMPRLPLYQRPTFVAYKTTYTGIAPSPALGVFWNTRDWGMVKPPR